MARTRSWSPFAAVHVRASSADGLGFQTSSTHPADSAADLRIPDQPTAATRRQCEQIDQMAARSAHCVCAADRRSRTFSTSEGQQERNKPARGYQLDHLITSLCSSRSSGTTVCDAVQLVRLSSLFGPQRHLLQV